MPIGDVSSFDFEGTAFAPHKVQGKILSISFLNPKSSNYEQNLATLTKYQTQFKFKEDLILLTYLFDQPDMAMDTMVDRLTAKFPKWKFLKLPVDGQEILRKDFGMADSLLLGNKLEDVARALISIIISVMYIFCTIWNRLRNGLSILLF